MTLNLRQFGTPYFPGNDKTKASQGKLFHDPKPVDEHRYQRGYTPARMAEVRGMTLDIQPGEKGPFTGPGAAHRVHEVIARSTTPAHEHVEEYNGDKGLVIRTAATKMGNAAAFYQHPSYAEPRGSISLGRTNEIGEGQNLMHELGHYRSSLVDYTEHANPDTPVDRGREEAFADENMMSRWRPDPREVRRFPNPRHHVPHPSYEYELAFKGMGGKKAHKAYLKARTSPIQKDLESARHAAKNADASFQPNLNNNQFGMF